MDIVRNDIGDLDTQLTITVQAADYLPKFKKKLKEISKEANIKGFRKGQVPLGYVKKMFGQGALMECLDKLINEGLNDFIDENKLEFVGQPFALTDDIGLDIKAEKDYNFEFLLGLSPELNFDFLEDSTDKIFTEYQIEVADNVIDESLGRIQQSYATQEESDAINDDKDLISVELVELLEGGEAKEDGLLTDTSFLIESFRDGSIKDQVKALKIGENMILNIFDAFDRSEDEIVKFILNQPNEESESYGPLFRMKLEKVQSLKLPELDSELFKKATQDEIDNLPDFKERIKEATANQYKGLTNNRLFNEVIESLIEDESIKLPEQYMNRWFEELKKDKKTEEEKSELESQKDAFFKSIKWTEIRKKLGKKFNIEISREDIEAAAKQKAADFMRSYIGYVPDDSMLQGTIETLLKDKQYVNDTFLMIMENRIAANLFQYVTTNVQHVTLEEFQNLPKLKGEAEAEAEREAEANA